jgi:hypothetical protein
MRAPSRAACPDKPADPIIVHADVRRMLLTQKAVAEGGRACVGYLQQQVDLARSAPAAEERALAEQRLGFLTPIAKGVLTELGVEAANHAIQVFGGHGFIAENGVEQIARDARITTIWEGTTGIQALDLLGRKVIGSEGAALDDMTGQIAAFCDRVAHDRELAPFAARLRTRMQEWCDLTRVLIERAAADREEIGAASHDYLMYSGYVVLGYFWGLLAEAALRKSREDSSCGEFCRAKLASAEFYFSRILPRTETHKACMLSGAATVMLVEEISS